MNTATVSPPAARAPAPPDATPAPRPGFERPLPLLTPGQWAGQINRQLAECRRHRTALAVLAVAVDAVRLADASGGFGAPADAELGERIVDLVAQRLRSRVRATDRVVRIGANRYGLLLCGSPAALAADIETRLVPALVGPYRVDTLQAFVQLRSGLAVHPQDGSSGESLLRTLAEVVEGPAPAA